MACGTWAQPMALIEAFRLQARDPFSKNRQSSAHCCMRTAKIRRRCTETRCRSVQQAPNSIQTDKCEVQDILRVRTVWSLKQLSSFVCERRLSAFAQCLKLMPVFQGVPGNPYQSLQKADATWHQLCNTNSRGTSAPQVVTERKLPLPASADTETQDVIVLGGTLGIFLATALLLKGRSVTVVERNALLGRDQEWNISRADMQVCIMI